MVWQQMRNSVIAKLPVLEDREGELVVGHGPRRARIVRVGASGFRIELRVPCDIEIGKTVSVAKPGDLDTTLDELLRIARTVAPQVSSATASSCFAMYEL